MNLSGRLVAVLAWLALSITGCGSGGSPPTAAKPGTTVEPSATTAGGTSTTTTVTTTKPSETSTTNQGQAASPITTVDTQPSTTPASATHCPDTTSFTAAFLPDGFSDQLLPGSGGQIVIGPDGSVTPIEPVDPTVHHYAADPGRYIDIRRGVYGERPAVTESIAVLGHPARFGTIEDGYSIEFSVDGGTCGTYRILAYGVTADEVKRTGSSLVLHP